MTNKQPKTDHSINQDRKSTYKLVLQPVTMRIFNSYGIYFPSKLQPEKIVTHDEFLEQYADFPIEMLICFDDRPDYEMLLEQAKAVTAYGFGLDCYYIITHQILENVLC